jgi:hypothetical protein
MISDRVVWTTGLKRESFIGYAPSLPEPYGYAEEEFKAKRLCTMHYRGGTRSTSQRATFG